VASRREFFRSLAARPLSSETVEVAPQAVRPPYGTDESLFQSECIVCESKACATSCDEKIIIIDDTGIPKLDFSTSGCTFCEECANACEAEVLSLNRSQGIEWINAMFRIDHKSCIAHNGVICFACKEPCMENAIVFNGMFNPVIDEDLCNGCGFCLSRCPTDAISFSVLDLDAHPALEEI